MTASEFVKTLVVFDKNEQEKHDRIKAMSSERVANAIVPVGQTTVVASTTPYQVTWLHREAGIISRSDDQTKVLVRAQYEVRSGNTKLTNDFVYALTFSHGQVNDYAVYIQNQQQGILGWSTKWVS